MTVKMFKHNGHGETLWKAIGEEDSHHVQDWVDGSRDYYMYNESDLDRIQKLVWDMESQVLINFFNRFDYNLDGFCDTFKLNGKNKTLNGEEKSVIVDREVFKVWKKLANPEELEMITQLEENFSDDLDGDRIDWANERAWDDFYINFDDVDVDNDKEVAAFFGIVDDIIGFVIDGEEFELQEIVLCPICEEPNEIEKSINVDDLPFCCEYCGANMNFDEEFVKMNKHIPNEVLVAWRV